jgi:cell division protein FtsQ
MRINWKKILIITLDSALAIYLMFAFTAFNKPDGKTRLCTKVNINIQDEATNGFIDTHEIKNRLKKGNIYPLKMPLDDVNSRKIEETLKSSPFVKTVECYKTQDGQVCITLTQRMPVVRIKSDRGDDYYLDDNDCIMPNSHYTSDLIIATGHITKWFATNYISPLSKTLMENDLWKNQIEQINVMPDLGIELVPRVGNHIVYIGQLPYCKYKPLRNKIVSDFVNKKMDRLEKFYKYGLSQAGWNKYSYINLEFDNQIICKKVFKEKKDDKSIESALAVSDNIGGIPVKSPEAGKAGTPSPEKGNKSEANKTTSSKKELSGNTANKKGNNKTRI